MSKPFEVQEAERVIAEVQAQLADAVTITISREAAQNLAEGFPSDEAADAAQLALENAEQRWAKTHE